MANFTESLTVRILADSSELTRGLEEARRQLRTLGEQIAGLSNAGRGISSPLERLSSQQRGLEQVSTALSRISAAVRELSVQSITLNVAPALSALQNLSAMVDLIRAKLASVGAGGIGSAAVSSTGNGIAGSGDAAGGGGRVAGFASGGMVSGPAGLDRVPAMLSRGEFVLQSDAVDALGVGFLQGLNAMRPGGVELMPASGGGSVHQYGDITINVRQPGQVRDVVRDLQFQGFRLRQRRG